MLCCISLGDGDLLQLPVVRGSYWDCFLCSQVMKLNKKKMHPFVKRLSKKSAGSKPVLGGSLFLGEPQRLVPSNYYFLEEPPGEVLKF
jgi:hypothetical protein